MSVRRLNKLKLIVGCATAALFVSLLFPIGIAAKSSLDSPGDQGTILIIASYNPDTRRMSSFISDFEHKIANENVPFEILIEDLGCKSVAEANLWKDRLISVLERYDRNRLKAVILLGASRHRPAGAGGMGIVRLPGQFSPGHSVFRMLRQHERNSAPGPEPSGYG